MKDEDKPVIVTAANSNYYDPLQATVYHVHKNFPDYRLIVYDLGLTEQQHEKVCTYAFMYQNVFFQNFID